MIPGHVFIVRSDLTKLSCDDWLLPGDRFGPGESWKHVRHDPPPEGATWLGSHLSVLPWQPLHEGGPRPWLVKVGTKQKNNPEWHIGRVQDFLAVLEEEYRTRAPARRRSKHLVAVPLVGTGGGGAAEISGKIVSALLDTLYAFTERTGHDVALVLYTDEAHHAAQSARRMRGDAAWQALDEPTKEQADLLAKEALSGTLALFLGAGVSAAAGLPAWDTLLASLAETSGLDEAQRASLAQLSPLDRAHIIERKLGSELRLFEELRKRLDFPNFSLAHAMLAALPSLEAVTTNYDTLFEQACAAIERPVTVIPEKRLQRGQRWLLKLHGSIDGLPKNLVLTRQSYLRYGNERSALAGTVAGLLLTRHMLFVGFSMSDDNFLRIADEVRRATQPGAHPSDRSPLGTSLAVDANALHREIWGDELRWVDLGPLPEGGRRLELTLDRALASSTTPTQHLFDPHFASMLSEEERALRDSLRELRASLPAPLLATPAGLQLDAFLAQLGWRPQG